MTPKQIKIIQKSKLKLVWNDDSESLIELKYLRDECPCAGCKGETVLFKTYLPPTKSKDNPDMYVVTDIQLVGEYAIQVSWKDGHNTGIYSWQYLRQLEADQDSGKTQDYNKLL